MIGFLILLLHVLVSPFKTQARLEAEIVLLRHQLSVLRQRVPSRPKLTVADRLLFCLALSPVAVTDERSDDCPAGDRHPMASDGVPTVLALEVALSRRSAKDPRRDPAPDSGDELGQPAVGRAAHSW